MRARMFVSCAVVLAINVVANNVVAICGSSALGQPNDLQYAMQIASCPTILPAEEGERSIVVPNEAPPQQVPHIASLPKSPEQESAKSLLKAKLAERDLLQREIIKLQESTLTPEHILVRVQVVEVNRTKLRDLSAAQNGGAWKANAADLLGVGNPNGKTDRSWQVELNVEPAFLDLLEALEKNGAIRYLGRPTVVVTNGRPALVHSGSEILIPQPGGAAPRVEKIGTQVDLTAVALGENRVRIEVRPRVREIDAKNSQVVGGVLIPAMSVREFDSTMEMQLGATSVLSGLVQERVESKTDSSGHTYDEVIEVALMLVVTPEIVR